MALLRGGLGEVGSNTRATRGMSPARRTHEPRPAGDDAPATGPSAPVEPPRPSRPAAGALSDREAPMSHPMRPEAETPVPLRWARLRFSIIGPLLASPPKRGELADRIATLAATPWKHPTSGEVLYLSGKTIEKLFYAAR